MKKVRINNGKIGVVIKKGDYDRVLKAGTYWIGLNRDVVTYCTGKVYVADENFDFMMLDPEFRALVRVVEVKDNEIALKYVRENFETILTAGRYFCLKDGVKLNFATIKLDDVESTDCVDKAILNKIPLSTYVQNYTIESSEEGLLLIDGKMVRKLSKGRYAFWNGTVDVEVKKADIRNVLLEISGQELLTKDKAALRLNFQVQYRITDIEKALLDNKDYERQLYTLTQLALREFVGTLTLDELLEAKEQVSAFVLKFVSDKAKGLGVEVNNAGVRDIILPGEVRDIMNQVLIAQKQAQANSIVRREETASTRSLLNTAKLMEDNEMLCKLKEMEYIEKIAERIGEINVSSGGQVVDQLARIFSK